MTEQLKDLIFVGVPADKNIKEIYPTVCGELVCIIGKYCGIKTKNGNQYAVLRDTIETKLWK